MKAIYRPSAVSPLSRRITFFAIVVGVPLLALGALHSPLKKFSPPSDALMILNFQRRKPILIGVLGMSQEYQRDGSVDILSGYQPTKINAVPDYRKDECVQMLRQAGLSDRFDVDTATQSAEFNDWKSTMNLNWEGDAYKGYAYFTAPPQNVRQSLDSINLRSKTEIRAYRHIEGNWYLYLSYFPYSAS